jgi:acetyl-CoA carboxylase biotin carboxyl carrier protein
VIGPDIKQTIGGAYSIDVLLNDRRVPQVLAPITGLIWKIRVTEGETVAVEQVVVVLESMKLEIPVESEHAGVVARIAVAEGDAVIEGDVLIELG